MPSKPDFQSMTNKELLALYNETAVNKRKSAFPKREEAIRRAELEWMRAYEGSNVPVFQRKGRHGWKLEVLTENPHREGSQAHKFFEDFKASPTIGDLMNLYDNLKDRQRARIYLNEHKKHDRVNYAPD